MLVIHRCQDYVLIDGGPFATTDGNTTSVLELATGTFTVFFRTGEEQVQRIGFQMLVVCFDPVESAGNIIMSCT